METLPKSHNPDSDSDNTHLGLHKGERVVLKEAIVDKMLVPIVKWINSYSNLITLAAIQGNEDDPLFQTYLAWTTMVDPAYNDRANKQLQEVLDALNSFGFEHYRKWDGRNGIYYWGIQNIDLESLSRWNTEKAEMMEEKIFPKAL